METDHAEAILQAFTENPSKGSYSLPVKHLAEMSREQSILFNVVVQGFVKSTPGIVLESSHDASNDTIAINWYTE